MKKTSVFLLCAAALCGGTQAHAQDKATLDLLVKKGLITREEADSLTASAAKPAEVTVKDPVTKRITVGGLLQARYSYISENDKGAGRPDPADVAYFNMRRVIFTFTADVGQGWGGCISPELDPSRNGVWLDRAVVSNTNDYGVFNAGLRKVNFGREEYVSAATELLPVERSVATRYFCSTQFAAYHAGVYWDGKVKDTGLIYGAAITNAAVDFNAVGTNDPAFWGNVAYTARLEKGVTLTGGVNLGEALRLDATHGDTFGYNPYVTVGLGKLTLTGEILGFMTDGKGGVSDAEPIGYNLTGAFRATDELEPVVRFSHLSAGGMRASVNRDIAEIPHSTTDTYDDIWAFYAGLNYYVIGNNVKFQGGYEFSQLIDSIPHGSQIDAHALRAQLQVMF